MEPPTANINMPPSFSASTVLFIDDEPQVLSLGRAVLASQGFEVACAASGERGMELLFHAVKSGQRYAACVLDLTLPGGLSGFEVLEQMRVVDSMLPVIASSGYFEEDARELCRSIGFYDILAKPYTPDGICSLVRRAVAGMPPPSQHEEQDAGAAGAPTAARSMGN
jgi:DNA-binding NtrC family response regulator